MLQDRDQALALLRRYNQEPFHIRHALTVEAVMGWYARFLGYGVLLVHGGPAPRHRL